jgi:peroxiredoxin
MQRRQFIGLGLASAVSLKVGAAPKVPRPAGEFVMRLTSKELVLLSRFRGRPVVMEFLMTTCPHCQKCSSILQKLMDEYGSQVQFLGAAFNEGADYMVPGYIAGLRLKFPVGVASRDSVYEFLQLRDHQGPVYVPQLVFIDKNGMIRAQYSGDNEFFKDEENNIRREVEALLKGAPAARKSAARKS